MLGSIRFRFRIAEVIRCNPPVGLRVAAYFWVRAWVWVLEMEGIFGIQKGDELERKGNEGNKYSTKERRERKEGTQRKGKGEKGGQPLR